MSPEEILVKLKENASARARKTLDAIYEICDEQRQRGVSDYSIVTIARLGYKRGVPRAQSLRNKTAESYRALISAFENNAPSKNISNVKKTDKDWIEEIQNPKHKLLVNILASELLAAQKKLKEFIPPNTVIDVYDHKNANVGSEYRLTEQERRSLEYLLSKSFRNKWHFSETEYGELVDENNQIIFKAATIDAIKKALLHL